ncbi:hypothetical protein Sjap_005292 [Stephania japonica]|uniref:Uncharacterized protein n=1 Tax=Stephania japonica TaxID=461633 RepID=A0AAP0PJX6_9MAGN
MESNSDPVGVFMNFKSLICSDKLSFIEFQILQMTLKNAATLEEMLMTMKNEMTFAIEWLTHSKLVVVYLSPGSVWEVRLFTACGALVGHEGPSSTTASPLAAVRIRHNCLDMKKMLESTPTPQLLRGELRCSETDEALALPMTNALYQQSTHERRPRFEARNAVTRVGVSKNPEFMFWNGHHGAKSPTESVTTPRVERPLERHVLSDAVETLPIAPFMVSGAVSTPNPCFKCDAARVGPPSGSDPQAYWIARGVSNSGGDFWAHCVDCKLRRSCNLRFDWDYLFAYLYIETSKTLDDLLKDKKRKYVQHLAKLFAAVSSRMLTLPKMGKRSDMGSSNKCTIKHLKVLEIYNLVRCAIEFNFLQIKVKNALLLERVLIQKPSNAGKALTMFKKIVLETLQASSNVATTFF